MVANHGKFKPDLLAQKSACSYNSGDTFNEAMLLQHFERYASAQSYDGANMLRTWKQATVQLFKAVGHITSYRCFMLVADDGLVDVDLTDVPTEYAARFPDVGDFYSDEGSRAESIKLKARSLPHVVQSIQTGVYAGIGAGIASPDGLRYVDGEPRFLPHEVGKLRKVRLFKKLRESDQFGLEQDGYQKTQDPAKFCGALAAVVPYDASEVPGQCRTLHYGAREQQIKDQFYRYIPANWVSNKYAVNPNGLSGHAIAQCASLAEQPVIVADESVNERQRYDKHRDDVDVIALCPTNKIGENMSAKGIGIDEIAQELDLASSSVKTALKRLIKESILQPYTK